MTPYRNLAPDEQLLRRLEPEDEMRLLLIRAQQPRTVAHALILVGLVAYMLLPILLAPSLIIVLLPLVAAVFWPFVQQWRYLKRLRSQGYDLSVSDAAPANMRRVRVEVDDVAPAITSDEEDQIASDVVRVFPYAR